MKRLFTVFLVVPFGLVALTAPSVQARLNSYKDVTAWANRDAADAFQMQSGIGQANSASEMAAALQTTAVRQRKTTDDIIALVRVHPERRDVPTLGLDDEGLREWVRSHRDASARLRRAPVEAVAISQRLQRTIAPVIQNQHANANRIGKYVRDPAVMAAVRKLKEVLDDNRRRLLQTFA